MNLRIHLLHNGANDALVAFLRTAISFQKHYGTIIATDDTEEDFLEIHGYSKAELTEALDALKDALKSAPQTTSNNNFSPTIPAK